VLPAKNTGEHGQAQTNADQKGRVIPPRGLTGTGPPLAARALRAVSKPEIGNANTPGVTGARISDLRSAHVAGRWPAAASAASSGPVRAGPWSSAASAVPWQGQWAPTGRTPVHSFGQWQSIPVRPPGTPSTGRPRASRGERSVLRSVPVRASPWSSVASAVSWQGPTIAGADRPLFPRPRPSRLPFRFNDLRASDRMDV
jgi:hypothetical protein